VRVSSWSVSECAQFRQAQELLAALSGCEPGRAGETLLAAAAPRGLSPAAIGAEFLRCVMRLDGPSKAFVTTLEKQAAEDGAGPAGGNPCGCSGCRDGLPFGAIAMVSGALRVVTVHGELDLATRPMLAAALAEACCPGADLDDRAASNGLLLNLSDLTFLDASGLEELRAAHHRAAEHGLVLHVAAPAAAAPRRLLRLAVEHRWLDAVFAPPEPHHPADGSESQLGRTQPSREPAARQVACRP
jgi:anti-anti-sigma regulatory factor